MASITMALLACSAIAAAAPAGPAAGTVDGNANGTVDIVAMTSAAVVSPPDEQGGIPVEAIASLDVKNALTNAFPLGNASAGLELTAEQISYREALLNKRMAQRMNLTGTVGNGYGGGCTGPSARFKTLTGSFKVSFTAL